MLRNTVFAALTLVAALPVNALAGSATVSLVRGSLTNVNDAAGIWQIEGGVVNNSAGRQIGDYACTRRTVTTGTGGTSPQNTAMLTCTLFITGAGQNITLQGSHSYSSGDYLGSVSAASASFGYLIGADVVGSTSADSLTLTW